jgi:hypothetical protein
VVNALVYSYTICCYIIPGHRLVSYLRGDSPYPRLFSFIPRPFRLGMLDDLVQYCLTEIAYEGELGTRLVFLDRVTQICLAAGSNRSVAVY